MFFDITVWMDTEWVRETQDVFDRPPASTPSPEPVTTTKTPPNLVQSH